MQYREPNEKLFIDGNEEYVIIKTLLQLLTHSRLRMPQGSPGQGRGMPPGRLSRGFDIFSRHPEYW